MNFVISRSKLNACIGNFQRSVQLKYLEKKEEDEFSSKRTFPDKRLDRQVNELAKSRKKIPSLYQHISVNDRNKIIVPFSHTLIVIQDMQRR